MRSLMLIAAATMAAAGATYDPWIVYSTERDGDTMVIDPITAASDSGDGIEVEFDYFQGDKHVMRSTLSVTGCRRMRGKITLLNEDSDFGTQSWSAQGEHSYDLLAVRACNAAALKQKNQT